ncbi:MAG: permease [Candidatus Aminicenantes bacterium]|nr:permease [Candidatus Aminicenantes bacterium]MDH5466938.1 permease [Candidatus Aminicenantes bacterium]
MKDWKILLILIAVFLAAFWLPVENVRFQNGLIEGFALLKEYARDHVLLCLVPAFFIAGAISVFISKAAVIKYLGAQAKKVLSYGVASVSGTILAVCSCTVLPLFSGIYTRGAGIGPATAFLYSGPAINILAIILTAKVLGYKLGLARAVGAVVFAVVIGLIMHLVFGKEEKNRKGDDLEEGDEKKEERPLGKTALYFAVMIGILVFINWGKSDPEMKVWYFIYQIKWFIGLTFLAILAWMILTWFKKPELKEWTFSTWVFAKQILPLLFAGVLVAGLLLGRPGHEGVIPSQWVARLVGGNSLGANLFASVAGALMYFATLTEVPILQGLLGSGMGQGPALALLLSGPALSLPNMLVIRSVIGTKKTLAYILLVVIMATITGMIFGYFF